VTKEEMKLFQLIRPTFFSTMAIVVLVSSGHSFPLFSFPTTNKNAVDWAVVAGNLDSSPLNI
jgi:hypothetical protein